MRPETRFWLLARGQKRDEVVVRTHRVRITNTLRFWGPSFFVLIAGSFFRTGAVQAVRVRRGIIGYFRSPPSEAGE
jgi:hypothetical protein